MGLSTLGRQTGPDHKDLRRGNFFIFIFFFVDLSKIYVGIFFFQKCHPAAGSNGGSSLPPNQPAVSATAAL